MLPENELINDFQLDVPYERGPFDYMRSEPEIYRTQHFPPREPFRLTKRELMQLAKGHNGKFCQTISSYIYHCFSYVDIENSLEQLRANQPWLFESVK